MKNRSKKLPNTYTIKRDPDVDQRSWMRSEGPFHVRVCVCVHVHTRVHTLVFNWLIFEREPEPLKLELQIVAAI